jgi:hypothetical protein
VTRGTVKLVQPPAYVGRCRGGERVRSLRRCPRPLAACGRVFAGRFGASVPGYRPVASERQRALRAAMWHTGTAWRQANPGRGSRWQSHRIVRACPIVNSLTRRLPCLRDAVPYEEINATNVHVVPRTGAKGRLLPGDLHPEKVHEDLAGGPVSLILFRTSNVEVDLLCGRIHLACREFLVRHRIVHA